jgi:hypothetical protein
MAPVLDGLTPQHSFPAQLEAIALRRRTTDTYAKIQALAVSETVIQKLYNFDRFLQQRAQFRDEPINHAQSRIISAGHPARLPNHQ